MTPAADPVEFFARELGRPLRRNEPLAAHANFRIGGPADYFFQADSTSELKAAVQAARTIGLRRYVIGGGFNLLFDDAGFRGLIIKNASRSLARADEDGLVEAASGTPLEDLLSFALAQEWGGLEFLAGIPGTVGGAVYGNAGAFGKAVEDRLEEAVLLGADGREMRAAGEYFAFSYRHSRLKVRPAIVLNARFRLAPSAASSIRAGMDKNLALRAERHPDRRTAYPGSYFKNPVGPDGCKTAAGRLLDECGARGLRQGGAAVSPAHCNFIINEGSATASDVRGLAAELRRRVREAKGIELEEEVIFLPAGGGDL